MPIRRFPFDVESPDRPFNVLGSEISEVVKRCFEPPRDRFVDGVRDQKAAGRRFGLGRSVSE